MASVKLMAAIFALTLGGVAATTAHAADPVSTQQNTPLNTDPTKALVDRNQWGAQANHKSFEWDNAKSRWGLKLDLDQQGQRSLDGNNLGAGAYYKITPSLRVGAGVALTDTGAAVPREVAPQQTPQVHLETAFKF
jgi:hypothetical protein